LRAFPTGVVAHGGAGGGLIHDGGMDRPTFVFDGDCAFCSSCARFIENRIKPDADVVAWQFADLAAVYFVAAGRTPSAGPAAIADLLRRAGGWAGRLLWRPAGAVLGLRPVTAA